MHYTTRLSLALVLTLSSWASIGITAEKGSSTAAARPAGQSELQEKLNQRIDLDIVEMPLKDVCLHLNEKAGIQIYLQLKKLEEASVSADCPITKSFKQVRLNTILELMLKDLELTYIEKDGLLLITTPEDAESSMEIRVYDCRDLLAMPAPQIPAADRPRTQPAQPSVSDPGVPAGTRTMGGSLGGIPQQRRVPETELERRTDQLTDLITSSVQPDSWDEVGGPGSITSFNGIYVVAQTMRVQDKVEQLLNLVREPAGLEARYGRVVK